MGKWGNVGKDKRQTFLGKHPGPGAPQQNVVRKIVSGLRLNKQEKGIKGRATKREKPSPS